MKKKKLNKEVYIHQTALPFTGCDLRSIFRQGKGRCEFNFPSPRLVA